MTWLFKNLDAALAAILVAGPSILAILTSGREAVSTTLQRAIPCAQARGQDRTGASERAGRSDLRVAAGRAPRGVLRLWRACGSVGATVKPAKTPPILAIISQPAGPRAAGTGGGLHRDQVQAERGSRRAAQLEGAGSSEAFDACPAFGRVPHATRSVDAGRHLGSGGGLRLNGLAASGRGRGAVVRRTSRSRGRRWTARRRSVRARSGRVQPGLVRRVSGASSLPRCSRGRRRPCRSTTESCDRERTCARPSRPLSSTGSAPPDLWHSRGESDRRSPRDDNEPRGNADPRPVDFPFGAAILTAWPAGAPCDAPARGTDRVRGAFRTSTKLPLLGPGPDRHARPQAAMEAVCAG